MLFSLPLWLHYFLFCIYNANNILYFHYLTLFKFIQDYVLSKLHKKKGLHPFVHINRQLKFVSKSI